MDVRTQHQGLPSVLRIVTRLRVLLALSVVLLALPGPAHAAAPDVTVSVADSPDPVSAGGSITYSITIANQGDASSGTITVTDALPAGLTRTSFGGPTCGSPSGNSITCSSLAPGESAQLQL